MTGYKCCGRLPAVPTLLSLLIVSNDRYRQFSILIGRSVSRLCSAVRHKTDFCLNQRMDGLLLT